MLKINKKIISLFVVVILAAGLIFVFKQKGAEFEIENQLANLINSEQLIQEEQGEPNFLTGAKCANYQRRPIAVVLASDAITRPLSGISQADLVFEMPVVMSNVTRIIAVYVCNLPKQIGSVRSARHDFIPLTMGMDAILAHWGGSHFALDLLDNNIMNNIDALPNPYNAFYQKSNIIPPHNGFTSMQRLLSSAEKLGYRLENKFEGYTYILDSPNYSSDNQKIKIDYSYPYNVEYKYDAKTNSYLRWRAGEPEIDKNNKQQVKAKNIVVMQVDSKHLEEYYNDLDIDGSGKCQVYQNGEKIDCAWQKSEKNPSSKLKFLDSNNQEIPFVAGQVWVEIVEK